MTGHYLRGGGGGYKMGKSRVRNFLRPPSRQGKTFCAPHLKSGNFCVPPSICRLKLQATHKNNPKTFCAPPHPEILPPRKRGGGADKDLAMLKGGGGAQQVLG